MMKSILYPAAAIATFVAFPAHAQDVTLSTGVDYSEGDFGSDVDTSILVVPVSLRASWEDFSISASIPYLEIDGSSSVIGGGEGPIIVDPTLVDTKRSGMGDLSLRARYDMVDLGAAELSLSGRVKLPTGDEAKGLSTGEADFAGGIEIAGTRGSVQPFGEIGYRVLGDPDGIELEDGLYASAGATVSFGGGLVGFASYDYVEASVDTIEDTQSIFAGLVIPAGDRVNFTTYGTAGLSDSAADFGVGVLLSFKLVDND